MDVDVVNNGNGRRGGLPFLAALMVLVANGADTPSKDKQPDPLDLLKTVMQARQRIASGEIEFDVGHYEFTRPYDGTNRVRLKVIFDGQKRRAESFERQYAYVLVGPEAGKLTDAKRRELGLDGEAGVRAGLLTGAEYHRVETYDGAVLMEYQAIDDKPVKTTIDDRGKGRSSYLFDPRVLGLIPSPSITDTVDNRLADAGVKSLQPVGRDSVEGVVAWHIRVSDSRGEHDYWIDVTNPSRLIKQAYYGDMVFSKFDAANPNDPLPTEVRSVRFYGPERKRSDLHFVRRTARFNTRVDPASWTLAGLNMPVGTEVIRNDRTIGYWNGSGLSSNPPEITPQNTKPKNPPNLSKLLELVEKDPKSPFAAHASFSVATLLKRGANEGSNEHATREAERLFDRVITQFADVKSGDTTLADLAKPELSELRRLGIGKVAQEIEGEDLDGRKMKLSDYRGKVVVLTFWGTWCPPCMQMVPDERKLVERMAGKPFALIGVNSDSDLTKLRAVLKSEAITWPSFRDGASSGPIAKAWNVRIWPTIYVLDPKGVIRYRNVRGQSLADAVDTLLRENQ